MMGMIELQEMERVPAAWLQTVIQHAKKGTHFQVSGKNLLREGEAQMNRFKKWAEKEYPITHRILVLIPAGFLFVLLIPFILVRVAPSIDISMGFPSINLGLLGLIAGIILIAIGLIYALWSISAQLFRASGTPLPMMATQKLLVTAPFDQCRNPMSFGTILLYLGISVVIGSISAIGIVISLSALLIGYIKFIEEQELEARFGEDYIEYKSRTPFLVPRIPKKGAF
jgi:protein-S-isoprenylcysteine O-methyltransferase Ste14